MTNQIILPCILSSKQSLILNNRNFYSHFYLGPFHSGQGLTIANALRRTLLSELNGLAITAVEIEGVMHEYSNIIGVKDTVLDILLNIKEIVIKSNYRLNISSGVGFLQVRGPGIVRACDMKLPSYLLCVDPQQYIATLAEDGFLNIKFYISKFDLAVNAKEKNQISSNLLNVDPVFSSITKVNYVIEQNPTKGSKTTDEFIILEIWTNGSLHPREALNNAFKKLVNIFFNLRKLKIFESSLKSNQTYTKLSNGLINRRFIESNDSLIEKTMTDLNNTEKKDQKTNYSVPFSSFDLYSLLNQKNGLESGSSKKEETKKYNESIKKSAIRNVTIAKQAAQFLEKRNQDVKPVQTTIEKGHELHFITQKTSKNLRFLNDEFEKRRKKLIFNEASFINKSKVSLIQIGSLNDSVEKKKETLLDFVYKKLPLTKLKDETSSFPQKKKELGSFSFHSILPTENIEFLNFSFRTYSILKDAEIHKIEDLLNKPLDELQNFGKRTLLEIKKKLNQIIFESC